MHDKSKHYSNHLAVPQMNDVYRTTTLNDGDVPSPIQDEMIDDFLGSKVSNQKNSKSNRYNAERQRNSSQVV